MKVSVQWWRQFFIFLRLIYELIDNSFMYHKLIIEGRIGRGDSRLKTNVSDIFPPSSELKRANEGNIQYTSL